MILYKGYPGYFSLFSGHLGARLLRAGKLVALLFLSAYESSAFEPGTGGQSGASIWKIFGLGVLGTVKRKELLTASREEWSKSWASAGVEDGGTLMVFGVAWGVTGLSWGVKSLLLEVVGIGMVQAELLRLWS